MLKLCSQADLELALGGAAQLVQLLDKDGDNIADKALVEKAIDAGCGELVSYFINIDLSTIREPYSPVLITKAADAAAFYAWRFGSYAQGVPESIVQGHDAAVRWAQDVGKKLATLGIAPDDTKLSERLGPIDHDPHGHKVSIAGFRKGFR